MCSNISFAFFFWIYRSFLQLLVCVLFPFNLFNFRFFFHLFHGLETTRLFNIDIYCMHVFQLLLFYNDFYTKTRANACFVKSALMYLKILPKEKTVFEKQQQQYYMIGTCCSLHWVRATATVCVLMVNNTEKNR